MPLVHAYPLLGERYGGDISFSHATQWGGRVIVMFTESTIHPIMVWHVDHEQSMASSFFSERTSFC